MTFSQAKGIFWAGASLSTVIFLALTFNSLSRMQQRTHADEVDRAVEDGKWAWQRHNCNDCHTILGIGGYYAPDLTKVRIRRDPDWLKSFLGDPAKVWPAKRRMPNLRLGDEEIGHLISFLTWVNSIDTNGWPPQPLSAAVSSGAEPEAGKAPELFSSLGCTACHRINGIGGQVGPDLSAVGARRSKEWIETQIKNPKSHNPNSIMPSFSRLSRDDLEALAAYLSRLK
jgi:nitric oxide reductase subunit C